MFRVVVWSFLALLLHAGLLMPIAVGTNSTTAPTRPGDGAVTGVFEASTDDFEFASFEAEYHLGRDAAGRATLRTVETLVAVFPENDQNRGIRRAIPERYQRHPTDLTIISVTDEHGNELRYEEDSDDDVRTLTIADDEYVHGSHSYVIEYEQRNITHYFDDTGRDEFYWDVNGLDWAQPFGRVTATVHLSEGLSERLTGHVSAVQGGEGSTRPAEIDGLTFSSDGSLSAHETLTFAIGFEPGTFTPRDDGFFASPAPLLSAIASTMVLSTVVWAWFVRRRYLRDSRSRGIIVPEYAPHEGINLLTASYLIGRGSAHAIPAQIVDLAVRGQLRLLERGRDARGREQKRGFRLELLDPTDTDAQEYKLVQAVFGHDPVRGAIRDLTKPSSTTTHELTKLHKRVAEDALVEELRKPYPSTTVTRIIAVSALAALAGIITGGISIERAFGGAVPIVTLLISLIGVIIAIVLVVRRPLAAKGVAIRDHLLGLKMYIKLAEADRLRYLQSPAGADRVVLPGAPDSPNEQVEIVHLYERLLPYAMLFGAEKKWAAELGRLYETHGEIPSWYVGVTAFNAANFSSGFSVVSSGLSGAYGASSTGGSGGASAGGGGGGGGGGGA